MKEEASRKCGHVALVGRPNAGKSTLLNRIIGEKVSIVSDKPQTTRHRILGVIQDEEKQMIFVDTPGIHRPGFRLNERMMDIVYGALKEVDVVVHLVDASESYGKGEEFALELVNAFQGPVILALNKIDLISKGRLLPIMESYNSLGKYVAIVPISALTADGVDLLLEEIAKVLPEREFLFPTDQYTDQLERTLVGEVIREKVLENTRQELPYSTAVRVEEFDESQREEGFVRITASIIVERPGQKKIVIGRGGQMVKKIGTAARKEIQALLDVPRIYLELNVQVIPDWRNREHLLNELGIM